MRLRLIVFVLVLASPFIAPAPAAAKCQPGRTNNAVHYWDGWRDLSGTATGGVWAQLNNYSPWVQPGYSSFAYTMLRSVGGSQYAQVGWEEQASGTRYTFLEWTHDGTYTRHRRTAEPTDALTNYTVLYANSPGQFTFQVNGSTWETQTAQFSPTASEIMAEVQTAASQMAGAVNKHQNLYSAHKWQNGGWIAYGGTVFNSTSSWYGNYKSSTYQDTVWDLSCSS